MRITRKETGTRSHIRRPSRRKPTTGRCRIEWCLAKGRDEPAAAGDTNRWNGFGRKAEGACWRMVRIERSGRETGRSMCEVCGRPLRKGPPSANQTTPSKSNGGDSEGPGPERGQATPPDTDDASTSGRRMPSGIDHPRRVDLDSPEPLFQSDPHGVLHRARMKNQGKFEGGMAARAGGSGGPSN